MWLNCVEEDASPWSYWACASGDTPPGNFTSLESSTCATMRGVAAAATRGWIASEMTQAMATASDCLQRKTFRRDIENQITFQRQQIKRVFRHHPGPEFGVHRELSDVIAEWKHESCSMRKHKNAWLELWSKNYQEAKVHG